MVCQNPDAPSTVPLTGVASYLSLFEKELPQQEPEVSASVPFACLCCIIDMRRLTSARAGLRDADSAQAEASRWATKAQRREERDAGGGLEPGLKLQRHIV